MPMIGDGSQIINFNYIQEFTSEYLNKFLYKIFTPGVLKFSYDDLVKGTNAITINEFSALLHPKNKLETLIKIDIMKPITIPLFSISNTYLVASYEWITPPNGYDYDDASDSIKTPIYCKFQKETNYIISTGHTLIDGDIVRFKTKIGGVDNLLFYYVINSSSDKFQISTTSIENTPLDLTSNDINYYSKLNNHLVYFDVIDPSTYNDTYHILIGEFSFNPNTGWVTWLDLTPMTIVYLNEYCINLDNIAQSGIRILKNSNPNIIGYNNGPNYNVGNSYYEIPVSNSVLNSKLNAEFLNGAMANNAAGSIALKNNSLSHNLVAARLFLNTFEYAIGKSGITNYSGFSGYTGISGWSGTSGYSSYSGYIPLNNYVLQLNLNAEYLGGYKYNEYAQSGHTHLLDEIKDGTTYSKIDGVDSNNLLTTNGINNGAIEYQHQDNITNPLHYINAIPAKIFMLSGEIGKGGSTTVTLQKSFSTTTPYAFLMNNDTDENKSISVAPTATGFIIHHLENTKSDGGGNLVSDTTEFSAKWLSVGEL